jgi:transposase
MYMSYSKNPNLPGVRMQAVMLVRQGWSARKTGRYLGFHHTAIMDWLRKAAPLRSGELILTESSRPHHHPKELSQETISAILKYRSRYRRCAEVIHYLLLKDGIRVSLSSVKRTLKRNNCSRYSKWKKWHKYPERPIPLKPGILVQIDTILE